MPTIYVVDDHTLLRQGLVGMLNAVPGMQVLGESHDGGTAVIAIAELKPDIAIIDLAMPSGMSGFEVCRRMRADPTLADLPVIFLTARGQARSTPARDSTSRTTPCPR